MPTTPTVYNAWRGGTNLTYISGGLYGFADPGTTVQIWNNGALFRTVTVPASGLWNTYGDPTPFPDGSYHVTAISVDAAGNKSAPSPVLSFLVDNTPPSAPTIVLDDPGAGAIVPARFSGTAEAGSAVTLSIGQTVIATAVADGTGHWRASAVLADGRFSITAVARDAAQNVSLAASTLDFVRTTADDFGNDVGHAGVIAVGGTAAGTVNYAGDSDWFKVSLDELTIYKFSLKGADAGGGTLPSVDGRPAAGLQLWDPQANDGKGAFFYLNPVFPVNGDLAGLASIGRSGDYYLIVNGSAPGTYTLGAVATAHDDYFGDWARATAISAGAQISGRFEHSSDVDTFKVMLTAGTTYVFELDGGADLAIPGNMRIEVMDGARTVGVYSDMNSMNQAVASLTPASSGEYFVSVSYSDYYYTGTGSYVLKVLTPPDDFGASVANSGKIAIGETVRGTNEVSGDRDWFEVTLQAGTAYTFAVDQGDLGSGLLYLHDATGARLNLYPQRYDHGNVLTWTPTTSGSYFVEVGSSGRPGPYILQARLGDVDDHGASPATAGQVNPGQFTSGRLEVPTDVDWYKVSLKANVFYSFRIDPTPEGLGGHLSGPNVSLVDASGRVQMGGMYDNGAGLINFQPTVDGDFYVTVSAFSQVFSYTISSSMNYDDRYLGSTATTGTLSPGGFIKSSVDFKNDKDWFKVDLQAGQRYRFELTGARGGGGTLSAPELKLYDANGMEQARATAGGPGYDPSLSFTATKSGTYYVQAGSSFVYDGTPPTGSYTLKEASEAVPLADTTPPQPFGVAGPSYPGDNPETANIRVLFNEPVVAGSGVIRLKLASGELVESFDVATSTRLSFNATTGELTIDPTAPLAYSTGYLVELDATAVKDKAGLPLKADYAASFVTTERGLNVVGGPGNDSYANTPSADVIDGGAGTDTVHYKGYSAYYTVRPDGQGLQVSIAGVTDHLLNVERIVFDDRAIAYDTSGTAGQAYRLYQASFNRAPDAHGLGFWIAQMDKGLALSAVAQEFIASAEFKTLFGAAPTDEAFITALYGNVLHRAPDQSGHDFWADKLQHGLTRADVLTAFSTSDENQAAVIGQISKGMSYIPYG